MAGKQNVFGVECTLLKIKKTKPECINLIILCLVGSGDPETMTGSQDYLTPGSTTDYLTAGSVASAPPPPVVGSAPPQQHSPASTSSSGSAGYTSKYYLNMN